MNRDDQFHVIIRYKVVISMSMWVYNRVICNKKARDKIINKNDIVNGYHFCCMTLNEDKISDDEYLLKFETHGVKYYDDIIRKIISKYPDTVWQCIEEEIFEQGKYYFDGEKVILEMHDLAYGGRNNIVDYLRFNRGTYIRRPNYEISIAENKKILTINDMDNFVNYDYKMSDEDYEQVLNLCKKYVNGKYEWQESSYYTDTNLQCELTLSLNDSFYSCIIERDNKEYETERKMEFVNIAKELNKIIEKYNNNYKVILNFD